MADTLHVDAVPPQITAHGIANGDGDATEQPEEQPPLPIDAPVPPSPSAAEESPPALPESAIPSPVPTPTVITVQEPSQPIIEQHIPVNVDIEKPLSAVTQGSEPMEIDPSTPQPAAIKRAGDELDGGREEKRMKEDGDTQESALPATPVFDAETTATPAPQIDVNAIPIGPDGQPLPPPAWHSYVPPAPKDAGPTTPLTLTQHKYMLNAIRGLKKRMPDAFNFLVPVDTVRFGIPHYHQVIDTPMDLGTVETKLVVSDPRGPPKDKSKASRWDLSKGSYRCVAEVVEDVRRIWENSRKFNGKDHPVSLMATRLEDIFERSLNNLPAEPVAPSPAPTPVAPPSFHTRRPSIGQPPVIRRTSDDTRPKREIHPPPSKDLAYEESPGSASRRPKRRPDPQIQWANRVLKGLESSNKYYLALSPFLYPVEKIIEDLPDYKTIIKRPIDLNHIKARLQDAVYEDVQQVDDDLRLMIANAQKFNPPGHEVHTSATQLLQVWEEKWRTLPPKVEQRDSSEDPLVEAYDDYSSDEDNTALRSLESQVVALNQQISNLRTRMAKRRASRTSKSKSKAKPAARKPSVSKPSPINTSLAQSGIKKHKKSAKETSMAYRDDDYESEGDEVGDELTHGQKQELAEKIGQTDRDTLNKVIDIIKQSTGIGNNDDEEIELDIDALPAATVIRLYNLVCRGGRGSGAKRGRGGAAKKAVGTGRKAMGGVNKRSVDEREEAERIKKMEEQLQMFERPAQPQHQMGYDEEESSSEEESSEEE